MGSAGRSYITNFPINQFNSISIRQFINILNRIIFSERIQEYSPPPLVPIYPRIPGNTILSGIQKILKSLNLLFSCNNLDIILLLKLEENLTLKKGNKHGTK